MHPLTSQGASAAPIVHIGYHKTATSWFQNLFYPAVSNARYIPREKVHEEVIRPRALDFDADQCRERLLDGHRERVIICEEELSGNIHVGGCHGFATKAYAHRIKSLFADAEIVLFTRPLERHVVSVYCQYVREGGTKRPAAYLEGWEFHPRNPSFAIEHFDHRKLTDCYAELFGADRVHVYDFNDFSKGPREFVSRFADELGIAYDEKTIRWDDRVNRSYGSRTLRLARAANLFSSRDIIDKHYFIHIPGLYEWSHRWLQFLNRFDAVRGKTSAQSVLGEKGKTVLARLAKRLEDSGSREVAKPVAGEPLSAAE